MGEASPDLALCRATIKGNSIKGNFDGANGDELYPVVPINEWLTV